MDTASIEVGAAPTRVWDLVTDIAGYHRFSPENTGGHWTGGEPVTVGATFTGRNRHGLVRWTTHCTVVDVVAGQRFSFQSDEPKARWTYLVEPTETGSRITETREIYATPAWYVRMVQRSTLIGSDRDALMQAGMRETLAKMKAHLER
ncbi:SRPBCC family protein [Rhodococcus sp. NPDC003318]|uniref:SRPBCC family protein n=1 Tax=Rhodococcus sp. NPDC003318 TaxID=3364503 RepID=UPI0036BB0D31